MFRKTILFDALATHENQRYMYHSMDASRGNQTQGSLWLYAGTGDYQNITNTDAGMDNLLIGIQDKDFPYFKKVNRVITPKADNTADISAISEDCIDTTFGTECAWEYGSGWYISLARKEDGGNYFEKVTSNFANF